MRITSPNTMYALEWNDELAQSFAKELHPILAEMSPEERIAALAYSIALAAQEHDGDRHEALDAVCAELLGQVVQQIAAATIRVQRREEKRLLGDGDGGDEGEALNG